MMRFPFSLKALPILLGAAIGCATLLETATAEAGRVRFSGGSRFSGRVHVRGGAVRFARPYWRPRVWVGGSVWVGGYYPRYYHHYHYPEAVPSYYSYGSYGAYGPSYYPVQPSVAAPAMVAAPAPRPLPVFGIGAMAGGTNVQDRQESEDVGLLARLRVSTGLLIEGELSGTSFENALRVDRRLGGSLIWELGARNAFAPYLLGGLGVQQSEVDGDFETTQQFGEIGVGLRLALSRNLHLMADIRAGSRETIDSDEPRALSTEARAVAPPPVDGDSEDYTRARLGVMLYF
jgi:hypothetical protein